MMRTWSQPGAARLVARLGSAIPHWSPLGIIEQKAGSLPLGKVIWSAEAGADVLLAAGT
jgi:hypothetical protein